MCACLGEKTKIGWCLGKVNRGKERRKPRRLPPPPSPLAAASTAADESDRERGERAIEGEGFEGGGSLGMKKGWKEMSVYIYILEKITTNYPIIYS